MRKPLADDDSSSLISRLPDELLLLILNKIIDLKTLCTCKLVSKRFSSIVVQIDSVSLTVSSEFYMDNCNGLLLFSSNRDSFLAARNSIWSFTRLRSLYIHLYFLNTRSFNFKWKVNISNRFDSFLFVSPISIYSSEISMQNEEEEDAELCLRKKVLIALNCFKDVFSRLTMLLGTYDFPLLEYVSVMDSGNWQNVCFNSSYKISQFKNLIRSEDAQLKQNLSKNFSRISSCFVSLLKLPVSGYVMKGVALILIDRGDVNDESYIYVDDDKDECFEQDKEAAAYCEAINEIFKKHKGSINRTSLVRLV
ncbi:uncharacterized protein [Rutidosis leptorrhynchoides]|uniref:uncharacterized protein isoform X1 n=1 Tax=Rutidosis leptorrhynchoides TaxID=125765 RepID=UPI003A99CD0C